MELIVTCRCPGAKEKAMSAFKLMFPGRECPIIYVGDDNIISASEKTKNENLARYLKAIAKKSGKFAYYIKTDDTTIALLYDLFAGKKVS